MKIISIFFSLIKSLNLRSLKLKSGICPLCGKTLFLRYNWDKWSVRCVKCGAAANSMALASVLNIKIDKWMEKTIYVNSASGPYFNFLKRHCEKLTNSLFFEDVSLGEYLKNIQCQDLQSLTYQDNFFEICTSAEIFEHVPDDKKAFKEIYRVLQPGGVLLFTVPFEGSEYTIERAQGFGDSLKYLTLPEYHNDSMRGGKVLCYRDYGKDILKRLEDVGFIETEIIEPDDPTTIGYQNPVIFCKKPL